MGGLGADGRGQAEAHRAQPAAGNPPPRLAELVVLGRPHLMLAHAGGDDRVAVLGQPAQLADGVLRQDAVEVVVVVERLVALPHGHLAPPLGRRRPAGPPGSSSRRKYFRSLTIGRSAFLILLISEGSMSTWTIFARPANSETLPVTRSSKRTPRASSRSAVVHGVVGVDAAVHAQHVQRERIVAGEAAQALQGGGHGDARLAGQRGQFLGWRRRRPRRRRHRSPAAWRRGSVAATAAISVGRGTAVGRAGSRAVASGRCSRAPPACSARSWECRPAPGPAGRVVATWNASRITRAMSFTSVTR